VPGNAPSDLTREQRRDPATAILLEFESPSAALVAQEVPARSRYTTWVLASMLAVAILLMAMVPIDRVVVTTGRVVPTSFNIAIQPLETSIVRAINVREGDIVKAGQVLAQLDPTFVAADASALETQVASLQAEVDRLQAEVDGRTYVGDGSQPSQLQSLIFTQRQGERANRLENYRQRIDSLRARVGQLMGDAESYAARLAMARQVEAMRVELERQQVGSKLHVLAAQQERNEASRLLEATRAQALSAQRELDALIAERDGYLNQIRSESSQLLTEQGRRLNEARESLNKARLRRELVDIRADRDSVVLSVAPINVGAVLQAAEQFMTLVPIDTPLEIEAVLDGRDAGFVEVGDPVTIKFDTFPYAIYGTAEGRVIAVSPDSFRNPDERGGRGVRPRNANDFGGAYYRTRMSIDTLKMHNLPQGFRLVPGMPVTADVKIGKRTILAYLFSRALPIAKEGLREP
jgi:HlyD family secretion protein